MVKQFNIKFLDNNKFITANGQTIIYIGVDKLCYMTIVHFAQKCFVSDKSFLMCIYRACMALGSFI